MRNQLTKFFRLNVGERRGTFAMLALSLIFIIASFTVKYLEKPDPARVDVLEKKASRFFEQVKEEAPETATTEALFAFNPNEASIEDLQHLGLPKWLAERIEKYRSKGGSFRAPADFAKIYGMPPELFEKLEPYIQLDKDPEAQPAWAKSDYKKDKVKQVHAVLVKFDPNTSTEAELIQLGLPAYTAKSILNYRSKGGFFKTPNDLKKIYSLSADQYATLEPYIQIAAAPAPATYNTAPQERKEKGSVIIDINQASAEDWQKLKGIGPTFAKKIILFRDKLGGFATTDMVKETYGLPDSVFQQIKPYLKASEVPIKLKVNSVDAQILSKHPMLDAKQAGILINYRNQHGAFKSVGDVAEALPMVSKSWLERVGPYLSFE